MKDLEDKEAELEKAKSNTAFENTPPQAIIIASNNLNSKITNSGGIDSGNDHNYCSDVSIMTSPPTTSRQSKLVSSDDLKRIEYQKMILKIMNEKQSEQISRKCETEFTSSSSTSIDSASQRIEERKRELFKRFDIQISEDPIYLSKKPPHAPTAHLSSQINQIITTSDNDKNTIYSVDSGHFSSSSTNFSRNGGTNSIKLMNPIHELNVQAVNLEVEKLNNEVLIASEFNKSKKDIIRQQQQIQLDEYLNGKVDENEYKSRIACLEKLKKNNLKKTDSHFPEDISHLFGLEFFDPMQNMSDVRDLSIENLFGWSNSLKNTKKILRTKDAQVVSQATSDCSKSSNDTLIDGDDDAESDSDYLYSKDDASEDEDSQALIISLLNSRKFENQFHELSQQDLNPTHDSNEWKRKFIQEQLQLVRKQREQLKHQHVQASNQSAFNVSNAGNKSSRVSVNLHELSTIKEVDTPKSERNLKLNQSLNGNNRHLNNSNLFNLQEISSSVLSGNSSLENVTQLNDKDSSSHNSPKTRVDRMKNNKMLKFLSDSSMLDTSVSSNASIFKKSKVPISNSKSMTSNTSFSSTSTPISLNNTQTSEMSNFQESRNSMREKQVQILEPSIYEYTKNLSQDPKDITQFSTSTINYAAKIYDGLETQSLSISNNQMFENSSSLLINDEFKKLAFKSTSFKAESLVDKSQNTENLSPLRDTHKKWFDILNNDNESNMVNHTNSEKINSMNSDLLQNPLSSTSSTNTISGKQIDFSMHNDEDLTNMINYSSSSTLTQYPLAKSELTENKTNISLMSDNFSTGALSSHTFLQEQQLNKINATLTDMDRTLQQYIPSAVADQVQNSLKNLKTKSSDSNSCMSGSILDDESSMSSRIIDSCASYTHSYSNGHASDSASLVQKQKIGLFDRFLKNYTSSSSIQDEPNLSFVSSQGGRSNQVSPQKSNIYSHSTSGVGSNTMVNSNSMEKTMNNTSLIQFQQEQLMKQFANMSPIENQLNSNSNSIQNMSSIDNFTCYNSDSTNETRFETVANRTDLQSTRITAKNLSNIEKSLHSLGKSLVKEITQNNMSTLIQDPIKETSDKLFEVSNTESALKLNSLKHNFTKFSQLEQIESADETIQQFDAMTVPNNNQTNLFSNISNTQNGSLASFEHHELTQCTPIASHQKSVAITKQKSPATFNVQEINENSTPFTQPTQSINLSASFQSIEDYKEKFRKFLDNLNTSDLHMYGADAINNQDITILSSDQDASYYR